MYNTKPSRGVHFKLSPFQEKVMSKSPQHFRDYSVGDICNTFTHCSKCKVIGQLRVRR